MPKSRFPALHSCFVSRHNIPLKKSICRKTAKVMRKFVIHWMFSRFYCCPLLRTPFGYFKQTYNTSIYPASFREIKSKYRVEKLSHIQLLEKKLVACCLEQVPPHDLEFKQATDSITFLSGIKGGWGDYFTQLITHQHHSSFWINWILCPGVQMGKVILIFLFQV